MLLLAVSRPHLSWTVINYSLKSRSWSGITRTTGPKSWSVVIRSTSVQYKTNAMLSLISAASVNVQNDGARIFLSHFLLACVWYTNCHCGVRLNYMLYVCWGDNKPPMDMDSDTQLAYIGQARTKAHVIGIEQKFLWTESTESAYKSITVLAILHIYIIPRKPIISVYSLWVRY